MIKRQKANADKIEAAAKAAEGERRGRKRRCW